MKLRIGMNRFFWGLRTGAGGFYATALTRACAVLARAAAPVVARLRPEGRSVWVGVALATIAPVSLLVSEGARSLREGTLLTAPSGTQGEVASLRGALARYYEQRESGVAETYGREFAVRVDVTAYTSRACETDDTPFITAANTLTRPGVVALSRDLLKPYTPGAPFDFGDVVHLAGLGDFVVEDAMAGRWERRVDIWFAHLGQARSFGRHKVVMTGPYGVDDYSLARARRSAQVASARLAAAP